MGRLGVLLPVCAGAGLVTAVALAAQTPKALRASILAAARAQHSVHYLSTSVGPVRTQIVGDVANGHGIQRITFTKSGKTGHVTVIVVNRTAYIRGDAFTLNNYMELPASGAAKYAGRWISVAHSNRAYSDVAAAVTLPSFVQELDLGGKTTRVSGTFGGRKVVGVRMTLSSQGLREVETLFARPGRVPLPLAEKDVVVGTGAWSQAVMARWNERVRVHAPAHTVPFAKVVQ
jgi:hypothetical protein